MNEPPPPEPRPYRPGPGSFDAPTDQPADAPVHATADEPVDALNDAPAEPPQARVLTIIAGVIAAIGLVAAVAAVALTDPQQSLGPGSAVVPVIAVAATLVAAVIGIIPLERRRGPRAVLAVIVGASTVGFAASAATFLPLPDLGIHADGYACPFYPTNVTSDTGVTADDPLPYGSTIAVSAAQHQQPWTTFTVTKPIDVTSDARAAGQRVPRSGSYFAVPVIRGIADDAVMACNDPLKGLTSWVTASGAEVSETALSLPAYPSGVQGGQSQERGVVTYYAIFDITRDEARSGTFSMLQAGLDGNFPATVYWGLNPGAEVLTAPPVAPGEASASPSGEASASPSGEASASPSGEASASPSAHPGVSNGPSTDVYIADTSGPGFAPETPHPFGTGQTMQSVTTHKNALRLVVGAPIDITKAAHAAGVEDPIGVYIAVPIRATEIDPAAISDATGTYYPPGYWYTREGGPTDAADVVVPGYPNLRGVKGPDADGTVHYYDIFDVPVQDVSDGRYQVAVADPADGTEVDIYWGAPWK